MNQSIINPNLSIYKFAIYLNLYALISYQVLKGLFEGVQYVKYLGIPSFIILFLFFSSQKLVIKDYQKPFLLICFVFLLSAFNWNMQGLMEIYFILNFLVLLMFKEVSKIKIDLRFANILVVLSLLLEVASSGINIDFSYFAALNSSTSNLDGGVSFYFGLFALNFLYQKKYFWFFMNIFFLIVATKRIVFLGVLVSSIIMYFDFKFLRSYFFTVVLIALNIMITYFLILLAQGTFTAEVNDFFGFSPGHLTQGRTTLLALLLPYFFDNLAYILIIGNGLGSTPILMQELFGMFFLIHNDLFKILFELGIPVFIIFFYLLYQTKTNNGFAMAIFINILLITDNVLIYVHVLAIYFLICHNMSLKEKYEKATQKEKNTLSSSAASS